jgi:hypothetical protein
VSFESKVILSSI